MRPGQRRLSLAAVAAAAALGLAPLAASASVPHDVVVSKNAADWTPQVVSTTGVSNPMVNAVSASGTTAYAGGIFDEITQGGQSFPRHNVVAFDSGDGSVRPGFAPGLDGQVRAVQVATDGGVYVGGDFKNVNGVSRGALVKLTADGAIDTAFRPRFNKGVVYDLELVDGHLFVAGSSGGKVMSLNPMTGSDDGLVASSISGRVCKATGECSWGTTSVYDVAVHGDKLAAVGNFTTVDGQSRSKFFMLDLGAGGATLSPWYYPGFAKECASTAPRRIANLQGIDFNPTGSALTVVATGQIPQDRPADIWYRRLGDANRANTTVCDAIGRFDVSDSTKPSWINYTGGDSVWTVADTGAAVYVQGHFKWVDNPDGYASLGIGDRTSGDPAARRSGIAAIDPVTGTALPWNPAVPTNMGGKALEATAAGLWVGSNSKRFGSETHRGLAFAPR